MKVRTTVFSVFLLFLIAASAAFAEDSEFLKAFIKAYNSGLGAESVVEKNRDKVPGEINTLVEESKRPGIAPAERDENLSIAEALARAYKNVTGDVSYLAEVKRFSFDLTLHEPVHAENEGKIHIVDIPPATATEKERLQAG